MKVTATLDFFRKEFCRWRGFTKSGELIYQVIDPAESLNLGVDKDKIYPYLSVFLCFKPLDPEARFQSDETLAIRIWNEETNEEVDHVTYRETTSLAKITEAIWFTLLSASEEFLPYN